MKIWDRYLWWWWIWLPLTLVHIRERRWWGEVRVWSDLRIGGGECWLRVNGATQLETCCTMSKNGSVGINSGSILGRKRLHSRPALSHAIDPLPSGRLSTRDQTPSLMELKTRIVSASPQDCKQWTFSEIVEKAKILSEKMRKMSSQSHEEIILRTK